MPDWCPNCLFGEKQMRVYGLKSSAKSLGWLAGLIFFALAVLYPSFPSLSNSLEYAPNLNIVSVWQDNFTALLTSGGIAWHVIEYLRRQTIANNPWTLRIMFTEFSPYCFVPVALPISVILLWRRLVDEAVRPTIVRGVLTALSALICSLALVFLLDWVGGHALLYMLRISLMANLEIRALISEIWTTALFQSVLLLLPCLVLGGLIAWRQGRLETRASFARRTARANSEN
jgi:hypothetical protein